MTIGQKLMLAVVIGLLLVEAYNNLYERIYTLVMTSERIAQVLW